MSGYLYKSFCYETVEQVADSIHSAFFLDGFGVIQSVSSFGSGVTVNYLNSNGNLQSFVYPLATCEKLGFDNSFTGLTVDDSIQISSAVVGVLIAAWCIKILRRVF
ncbi:MAG: hypothetical protein PHQ03_07595 [Methylococcales bacterium]|nr:hypothetical protein [Methylococcales bacterium]